jgi:hypothetical protein
MTTQAEHAVQTLEEALGKVEAAARALPADALRYTPGGDEWPIDWILRHIGTGVRFRLDLEQARQIGQFPPTRFAEYTELVKAASGKAADTILAETAADFRAYQDVIRALPDDALTARYQVTMPSGRQLDLSTVDNVQAVLAHTEEHLAQIRDWLARREA